MIAAAAKCVGEARRQGAVSWPKGEDGTVRDETFNDLESAGFGRSAHAHPPRKSKTGNEARAVGREAQSLRDEDDLDFGEGGCYFRGVDRLAVNNHPGPELLPPAAPGSLF